MRHQPVFDPISQTDHLFLQAIDALRELLPKLPGLLLDILCQAYLVGEIVVDDPLTPEEAEGVDVIVEGAGWDGFGSAGVGSKGIQPYCGK